MMEKVVHWRREWQGTCSILALGNPMNSMKRQKYGTLKDELPRLVGAHDGETWSTGEGNGKALSVFLPWGTP